MSDYAVPTSSPQITVQSRTFAAAAFGGMMGLMVGVFENDPVNGWTELFLTAMYGNINEVITDVKVSGGMQPYLANKVVAPINSWFQQQFGVIAPMLSIPAFSGAEPTTDDAATAAIEASVISGQFLAATAEIPPALRADYDGYWTTGATGSSLPWCGGSLTKFGERMAFYVDPSGSFLAICPVTDLNALAKKSPAIAAAWLAAYNFHPV